MAWLFLQILNLSLTGGLTIVLVLLIRILLHKAPSKWRYLLWIAPAIRLICPISFTAWLSPFAIVDTPNIAVGAESPFSTLDIGGAMMDTVESILPGAGTMSSVNHIRIIQTMAGILWMVGAAVMLTIEVIRYLKMKNWVSDAAIKANGAFETERIRSSFILGIIHPHIYLPIGIHTETEKFVMAHERYHLRRKDYLIKMYARLLLIIHWFNPLVWLAFYLMSEDMEMSCDEGVLSKLGSSSSRAELVKAYSDALLSMASGEKPLTGFPAFGEGEVRKRIMNSLRWKQPPKWQSLILALVCMVFVTGCLANPGIDQSQVKISKLSPEELVRYVGLDRTEVLSDLSKSEINVDYSRDFLEILSVTYPMEGQDYTVALDFSSIDDKMLGFQYMLTGDEDSLFDDLEAVLAQTQRQYGEPSTYPGLDTRYLGPEDGRKVFAKKGVVCERWDLSKLSEFSHTLGTIDVPCVFKKEIRLERMEDYAILTVRYHLVIDLSAK